MSEKTLITEKKISIIVPVLNEVENINSFIEELSKYNEKFNYEIIFCSDPSSDGTEELLLNISNKNPKKYKALLMSRKFGQNSCIVAGMEHMSGDAAIIIDVDGQDPVSLIPSFIKKWQEGYMVVSGRRTSRKGETYLKRKISFLGMKLINKLSNIEIPKNVGEFRLIDKSVVKNIISFKEANPFVRGIIPLVGFKESFIEYEREPRYLGDTKYNKYTGSLLIGVKGVASLSNKLLYYIAYIGFISSFLSIALGIAYFIFKVRGYVDFPIGNPTIVILILFVGGIQLLALGVIGIYIGEIFDNVKNRPRYIIEKYLGDY